MKLNPPQDISHKLTVRKQQFTNHNFIFNTYLMHYCEQYVARNKTQGSS
jgi:hypothetical protein